MSIKIEQYTEKSIVVCGDTKDYKETLKTLGGKWNARLKTNSGETFCGWIYPKDKLPTLNKWLSNISTSTKKVDNTLVGKQITQNKSKII